MILRPQTCRRYVAGLVLGLLVAACVPGATVMPSQGLCDGIPAEMGGCSSERPVFSGLTCHEIALEWANAIDRHVVAIMRGAPTVDGKQRSGRISDAVVVSSVVAGMRLDSLGLIESCDAPEFLESAEPGFSDELREGIPANLYDGLPEGTMDDWRALLARGIGIIDEGE